MLTVKIHITKDYNLDDKDRRGFVQENRISADENGQVLIFNSLFSNAELQVFHSQLLNAIGKRYINCKHTIPFNF